MDEYAAKTKRIKARNDIAKEYCALKNIAVNDLFSLVEKDPDFYRGGDGTHLAPKGVDAQARQVAKEIMKAIAAKE